MCDEGKELTLEAEKGDGKITIEMSAYGIWEMLSDDDKYMIMKDTAHWKIISEALENKGLIAVVDTLDEAIELANLYAPEHVLLLVERAKFCIDRLTNAGCVVIGEKATVAIGDYVAGPSHVLPTEGTARFSSPLNIIDFIKVTNVVTVDKHNLEELGQAASTIATAEGFDGHAEAIRKRLEGKGSK